MNIVLETQVTSDIQNKYILLELDSFRFAQDLQPIKAYCLIEKLPLNEMIEIQQYIDLHHNLISNYRRRNWNYCEQAMEHLMGKWQQQLDTFYEDLLQRVQTHKVSGVADDWDGIIQR